MIKLDISYFCRDIDTLSGFYAAVFEAPYIEAVKSSIYRALDVHGMRIGFHDFKAYALMELGGREMTLDPKPVGSYISFSVPSKQALDTYFEKAKSLGAKVIKGPYVSYYNANQVVLSDPEGNMFRISHQMEGRAPGSEPPSS
jgi:catechol 2,3-dioxygenase-like lactoylglutathione lyase family enzyme